MLLLLACHATISVDKPIESTVVESSADSHDSVETIPGDSPVDSPVDSVVDTGTFPIPDTPAAAMVITAQFSVFGMPANDFCDIDVFVQLAPVPGAL